MIFSEAKLEMITFDFWKDIIVFLKICDAVKI